MVWGKEGISTEEEVAKGDEHITFLVVMASGARTTLNCPDSALSSPANLLSIYYPSRRLLGFTQYPEKAVKMGVVEGMEKMAGRIQQSQLPKIWSLTDRRGGDDINSNRDKQQDGRQVHAAGTVPVRGTSHSKAKFKASG